MVQRRQEAIIGVQRTDADAQQPARHFLISGDCPFYLGNLLQRLPTLLPIEFTVTGKAHITCCPREEAYPNARFFRAARRSM